MLFSYSDAAAWEVQRTPWRRQAPCQGIYQFVVFCVPEGIRGFFPDGATNMLGIDIGCHSLKIVEMKGNRLVALRENLLPDRGENGNGDQISNALEQTITEMGARKKPAWGSIGGASVITHISNYPQMELPELEGAVQLEAEQFVSRDWEEMDFDFQILEQLEDGSFRVVFVAAPKALSDHAIQYFKAAGLYPVGVSAGTLAMATAFQSVLERAASSEERRGEGSIMIDIGAVNTSIAMLADRRIVVLRDVAFGGNDITKSVMSEFDTGFKEAEDIKIQPGERGTRLLDSVERALRPLLQQISITMGYEHRQRPQKNAIYLVGKGCFAPGLAKIIRDKFALPVSFFNPFEGFDADCELPEDARDLSSYTIAQGCALIGGDEHEK